MTEKQVVELAKCQDAIFTAVGDKDDHKVKLQMEVALYWIKKEIWKGCQSVTFDYGDPVEAANLQLDDIPIHQQTRRDFGFLQYGLIKTCEPGTEAALRLECWLNYIRWVEQTVDAYVSHWTGQHISVKIKKKP